MQRSDRLRQTARLLLDAVDSFADVHARITAEYAEPDDLVWQSTGRNAMRLTTLKHADSDTIRLPKTADGETIRFGIDCTLDRAASMTYCALLANQDEAGSICLALLYPKTVHLFVSPNTKDTAVNIQTADKFRFEIDIKAKQIRLSVSPTVSGRSADGLFDLPKTATAIYLTAYNCDISAVVRSLPLAAAVL